MGSWWRVLSVIVVAAAPAACTALTGADDLTVTSSVATKGAAATGTSDGGKPSDPGNIADVSRPTDAAAPDATTTVDGAVTSPPPPHGGTSWNNGPGANKHSYELILAANISWADAKAAASSKGGYLATITSAEENAFVLGLVADKTEAWTGVFGPWLGGVLEAANANGNGWTWVSREAWSFTKWALGTDVAGSPKQASALAFMAPVSAFGSGVWIPIPLTELAKGYVVEYDAGK